LGVVIRLVQIPFSHNCVKVRCALELKGLPHDTLDIPPADRKAVLASSRQALVPALEDGETRVAESTAILHYLETAYPETPLVPDGLERRAECWLVEDWADGAFMQLSRRLAYWELLRTPGALVRLWFPEVRGPKRRLLSMMSHRVARRRFHLSAKKNVRDEAEAPRLARLALDRLGGRPALFGERFTVADVALASMSAPLRAATQPVRDDPAVRDLLAWGDSVLGPRLSKIYRGDP
jgi:glutathione S-transferase